MILKKTFLNRGVAVIVEFGDPYFEDLALRRIRNCVIHIRKTKSGDDGCGREVRFDEAIWSGDRFNFTNLHTYPSHMSYKEVNEWLIVAGNIIRDSQKAVHDQYSKS